MSFIENFSGDNNFCTKCKLHTLSEHPFIMGRGNLNSKILILGDSPTKNDSILGKPFSASFGQSVERDLGIAGFTDYYMSYAVRCYADKKPIKVASKCCYPLTVELIKLMKPKIIIALGANTLHHLTGVSLSEETARQKEFYHPEFDTSIICTFNPKKFWGDNTELFQKWFIDDLKFAYRCYQAPKKRIMSCNPKTLKEPEEVEEFLKKLLNVEMFAFDIETEKTDDIPIDLKDIIIEQAREKGEPVENYADLLEVKKHEVDDEDESEESDEEPEETSDYDDFKNTANSKKRKLKDSHNPRKDKITDISFCYETGHGVHIPWDLILPNFDLFKTVMASPVKKVVQHGIYDVEFLECIGVAVNGLFFDTENAYHTLTASYEGGKAKGLYRLKTMNWFLTSTGGYNDILEEFGGISGYQNLKQRMEKLKEKAKSKKKPKKGEIAEPVVEAPKTEAELALEALNNKLEENSNYILDIKKKKISDLGMSEGEYYSALDSDVTLRISKRLKPDIDRLHSFAFYQSRTPLIESLALMRQTGIRLDVAHMLRLKEKNFEAAYKKRQEFFDLIGGRINLGSTQQLQEALFKTLKIKPNAKFKTKTGNSTNAEAISFYARTNPALKPILEYRTLLKANSTYIDGFLKHLDPISHRVHPSGMQISTATGRLSFTDPPIQTVPRDNDYRNMVIPRPGYKLVSADLSQAELRIVAMLANDEEMIKAFASGFDLHAYTASLMLLKIDPKDFNKKIPAHAKARTIAKSINFGIVYGTSAFALADQVNEALFRSYKEALDAGDTEAKFEELSVEEAQDNIDAWLNLYHGVRDWIINIKNFAATHGYVETIFGRRRYLPYVHSSNQGIREAELRKAVNTPVQSTANEIALLGLNKMTRFVKDYKMLSRPIMIIHDEIILECPDAEVDTIGEKLTESLTQNIPFVTIPLIADFGVMDKWQKD